MYIESSGSCTTTFTGVAQEGAINRGGEVKLFTTLRTICSDQYIDCKGKATEMGKIDHHLNMR